MRSGVRGSIRSAMASMVGRIVTVRGNNPTCGGSWRGHAPKRLTLHGVGRTLAAPNRETSGSFGDSLGRHLVRAGPVGRPPRAADAALHRGADPCGHARRGARGDPLAPDRGPRPADRRGAGRWRRQDNAAHRAPRLPAAGAADRRARRRERDLRLAAAGGRARLAPNAGACPDPTPASHRSAPTTPSCSSPSCPTTCRRTPGAPRRASRSGRPASATASRPRSTPTSSRKSSTSSAARRSGRTTTSCRGSAWSLILRRGRRWTAAGRRRALHPPDGPR